MNALAAASGLSMRYGGFTALDNVSLSIPQGSYTVLLGPSGSGKTTLLSILGGFLQPTSGEVLIAGQDCTLVPPAKRPTATVFQDYALFPHMTVGANVGFGLRMRGHPRAARDAKADTMLQTVGLNGAFDKKPHELSGGQRQRVALARALVVEPQLLLLDEPLGALDMKLRRQMQDELKALQKRVGTAFIHVTHDQEEAMALADHIVVMNNGRIEDQGPPQRVYERPASSFAASFMGESTIIPSCSPIAVALGGGMIAIRPEHIVSDKPAGNLGTAEMISSTFQGSLCRSLAQSHVDQTVKFKFNTEPERMLSAGEKIQLSVHPRHIIRLSGQ
jgi:spermidine/putrescine transport system ATP-binding protein